MELVPAMGDDRHSNVNRQRDRASTTIHERLIALLFLVNGDRDDPNRLRFR